MRFGFILGLQVIFAPGKPLTLVLNHADRTSDSISVNHTYNEQQIQWFVEGAALNIIRKEFSKSGTNLPPLVRRE